MNNWREASAQELIEECARSRDDAPWKEFLRRYHPYIRLVTCRAARSLLTIQPNEAEDLVQEVLVAISKPECGLLTKFTYRNEPSFLAYLKTIACHITFDRLRKEKAQKSGSGIQPVSLDSDASATAVIDRSQADCADRVLLSQIEDFLQAYPVREQQIFWLHHRHSYTKEAISRIPGMNLDREQVAGVLRRLLRHIKNEFSEGWNARKSPGFRSIGGEL